MSRFFNAVICSRKRTKIATSGLDGARKHDVDIIFNIAKGLPLGHNEKQNVHRVGIGPKLFCIDTAIQIFDKSFFSCLKDIYIMFTCAVQF